MKSETNLDKKLEASDQPLFRYMAIQPENHHKDSLSDEERKALEYRITPDTILCELSKLLKLFFFRTVFAVVTQIAVVVFVGKYLFNAYYIDDRVREIACLVMITVIILTELIMPFIMHYTKKHWTASSSVLNCVSIISSGMIFSSLATLWPTNLCGIEYKFIGLVLINTCAICIAFIVGVLIIIFNIGCITESNNLRAHIVMNRGSFMGSFRTFALLIIAWILYGMIAFDSGTTVNILRGAFPVILVTRFVLCGIAHSSDTSWDGIKGGVIISVMQFIGFVASLFAILVHIDSLGSGYTLTLGDKRYLTFIGLTYGSLGQSLPVIAFVCIYYRNMNQLMGPARPVTN